MLLTPTIIAATYVHIYQVLKKIAFFKYLSLLWNYHYFNGSNVHFINIKNSIKAVLNKKFLNENDLQILFIYRAYYII